MPLKRESLERQLERSRAVVDQVKTDLIQQGVAERDLNKQPKYRDASGDLRTIKRRLEAVTAKEAITAGAGADQAGDDTGSEAKKKDKSKTDKSKTDKSEKNQSKKEKSKKEKKK